MLHRQGFTLLELVVVLIIIAIATVFVFPNYTAPTEQALASSAQNNLLSIYTAQKNYNNNNGGYCIGLCGNSLANLNANLLLNIQNDGTYSYYCVPDPTGFACTASRNPFPSTIVIKVTNAPIQLTGEVNPTCTPSTGGSLGWCP